ncbi:hypothetical protein QBC34DRAFT_416046 [Podospora aff. communis PSN243]|uniref:Pathway-specific nitrogen regulator n=1 Tax=Podospora aff. communis PSN243 TaxID=3040156 RepID=A0AAV9G7Q1_9PEZI|nr:hypothetical protein QBC34DRAFT_416046 [Podospora aff. communis PSN243]
MPRKDEDFDFKIFVDPSCLSDPMDDETTTTQMPTEAASPIADIPVAAEPATTEATEQPHDSDGQEKADIEEPTTETQVPETADQPLEAVEEPADEPLDEAVHQPQDETEPDATEPDAEVDAAEQHDSSIVEEESIIEDRGAIEEQPLEDDSEIVDNEDPIAVGDESLLESERSIAQDDAEEASDMSYHKDEEVHDRSLMTEDGQEPVDESYIGDDAETPKAMRNSLPGAEDETESKPATSTSTDRKASLRTEALIQAAARAVVAKLEKRSSNRDSVSQVDEEVDTSLLSTDSQDHYEVDERRASYQDSPSQSRRESTDSQIRHELPASGDEGGDSSSQHEGEDDVFSDRSARSSLGSFDGHSDGANKPKANEQPGDQSFLSRGRSPRMSGVSIISGLSQYDKEDFVPTSRETRLPFRTPSDIRAMQMTSPTPSVFSGASPRSAKRHTGHSVGSIPRASHFQSPTGSAQYSPKGRSTPTRLKVRKATPPLVLLHVTLLPLRWMWGDVLDGLDPVNGKALDENKQVYEASEQLKTLRDAWRELQDCVGETVLERGVLLPHPQNDFEVLEERLLEALELPLRRRARILECGHYLGPSNIADYEDDESDDGYTTESTRARDERRHWCTTCKGDIKYESLGPGKVFRVKVYASNGLMKAGAWEACWKDMERVDVEVEPIVEPAMLAELERLAEIQMKVEDERQRAEEEREREAEAAAEEELRREEELERELAKDAAREDCSVDQTLPVVPEPDRAWAEAERTETERQARELVVSSPPPSSMQVTMHASPPQPPYSSALRAESPALMRVTHSSRSMRSDSIDVSEERMRRDEERMREIYGDGPTPYSEKASSVRGEHGSTRPRHPDSYVPPPSPRSPSEEAYERRQHRDAHKRGLENASFSDLLLEAFKVLLRDPKNVAIIVLCVFLTCVIVRPSPQAPVFPEGQLATYRPQPKQEAVMQAPAVKMETQARPQVDAPASSQAAEATLETPLVESVSNIIMETSAASASIEQPIASNLLEAPSPSEEPIVLEVASEKARIEEPEVVLSIPSEEPVSPEETQTEESEEPSSVANEEPEALQSIPSEEPEPVLDSISSEIDTNAPPEFDAPVAGLEESVALDIPVETDSAALEDDLMAPPATADVPSDEVAAEPASVEASDIPPSSDATVVDGVAANQASGGEQGTELADEVESLVAAAPEVEGDEKSVDVEAPVDAAEEALPAGEGALDAEVPVVVETKVETETVEKPEAAAGSEVIVEEAPLSEAPFDFEASLNAEAPLSPASDDEDTATTTTDEISAKATHPCESYVRSQMAADAAPTPLVFPDIQRITTKVFETITKTVRVRITTTETVSYIETAVPQTVEETVYETETLRVTVSIPVDAVPTPAHDEL